MFSAVSPCAPLSRAAITLAVVLLVTHAAVAAGADAAGRQTPIKLAVFAFELQDFSAAGTTEPKPLEAKYLAEATEATRRALAQSGRYAIIDTGPADLAAANGHGLSNCNGCDAAIAAKLGADQDLLGVVTKISMTEYTVTAQLRDTRTGAVINSFTTGLRIGAGYSWARGATWLMQKRLLSWRE